MFWVDWRDLLGKQVSEDGALGELIWDGPGPKRRNGSGEGRYALNDTAEEVCLSPCGILGAPTQA